MLNNVLKISDVEAILKKNVTKSDYCVRTVGSAVSGSKSTADFQLLSVRNLSSELEIESISSSSSCSLPARQSIAGVNYTASVLTAGSPSGNLSKCCNAENKVITEVNSQVLAKYTDSVASVYFDPVQLLAPTDVHLDSCGEETNRLELQAQAIVAHSLTTVLRTFKLSQGAGQQHTYGSHIDELGQNCFDVFGPSRKNETELEFAISDIKLQEERNSCKPLNQHFFSDNAEEGSPRNWLSASQPSCLHEEPVVLGKLPVSGETRQSLYSSIYTPDAEVLKQSIDLGFNQECSPYLANSGGDRMETAAVGNRAEVDAGVEGNHQVCLCSHFSLYTIVICKDGSKIN